MLAPNILITNYCNQQCPFCFASREMHKLTQLREMNLAEYKTIVSNLKKMGSKQPIKLLGGEPTLHSSLFEIIDYAIANKFTLQIFTNGVLEKRKVEKLISYGKNIEYIFNISTPGYQHNLRLRTIVNSNMEKLGSHSLIALSLTIDPFFQPTMFLKRMGKKILKAISSIRIGLGNPIAGKKNWYTFKQFPIIGEHAISLMRWARKNGFSKDYYLDCGFTRCMFTNEDYEYLKNESSFVGWGCFGKKSTLDISTNLNAFHCFPLSNHKRYNIKKIGYENSHRALIKMRMAFWSQLKIEACVKCSFYGYGEEKCPGPCIALRMNEKIPSN